MIIAIAYGDIECHSAIELTQVVFHVTAVLEDKVHDVKIAITSLYIATVSQTQQGHG